MFWLSIANVSSALEPIAAYSRPWATVKKFWQFCNAYGEYQATPLGQASPIHPQYGTGVKYGTNLKNKTLAGRMEIDRQGCLSWLELTQVANANG